jgi:hypothetical protein
LYTWIGLVFGSTTPRGATSVGSTTCASACAGIAVTVACASTATFVSISIAGRGATVVLIWSTVAVRVDGIDDAVTVRIQPGSVRSSVTVRIHGHAVIFSVTIHVDLGWLAIVVDDNIA